jgi:O-antigen/teichoic acid export membrane protein
VWAVTLIPALVLLRATGHANVFSFVFAWGSAAAVAAAIGILQARIVPRPSRAWEWVSRHRDLGPRYLLEGTASSASGQLRNYAVGLILGLAAVGYVQAATTLMGPFMVIYFGMGLVTLPEAARVLRRSPRHLPLFCLLVSGGLTIMALAWGIVLLVTLPRGLGHLMLGDLWRPTYPLVWPTTIFVLGACAGTSAGTGLHALGAARRSLRAMLVGTALSVVFSIAGTAIYGVVGTMAGFAAGAWIGALVNWQQLRVALREYSSTPAEAAAAGSAGQHRRAADGPAGTRDNDRAGR